MFDSNPFSFDWTAPPAKPEHDGCLQVTGRRYSSAYASTLAEGDVFIASDGSEWRAIHGLMDDLMTAGQPRRYLRNGWLCNH